MTRRSHDPNHIQRTLRQCALEIDPQGRLKELAHRMATNPQAVSHWIKKGRVPKIKALWLAEHFPSIVTDPSTLHG